MASNTKGNKLTEKEKEIQRALGLEKGYVARIDVTVSTQISTPILVRGFSEKDVREKLKNLPDDVKKKIILYTCNVWHSCNKENSIVDHDIEDLGEGVARTILKISTKPLDDIDPTILNADKIDIEPNTDTVEVIEDYMREELGIDDDEILII